MSYGAESERRIAHLYEPQRDPNSTVYNPELVDRQIRGDTYPLTIPDTPVVIPVTMLARAEKLVYGDREAAYSHPYDDFSRIAGVWSAYLGVAITAADVAQMMIGLKMCRARVDIVHGRAVKDDTVVDEAGYAECASRINERIGANSEAR